MKEKSIPNRGIMVLDPIAIVGLAAQLFTSVVDSYQFVSKARGLKEDAPILLWKLRIQEIRLRAWGRHWGIDQGKMDKLLAEEGLRDDVIKILKQIGVLLEDTEKLRSRYGLQTELKDSGDIHEEENDLIHHPKKPRKCGWS